MFSDEPSQVAEPTVDPVADLMTSIKSATNPLQLLDSVAVSKSDVKNMSSDQLMRTLHTLHGLHKATKDSISAAQIVGHPSFMILCQKLRRIAPSMDVSSNLNALKIISNLKIPANTELSLILVSLLRHQINDLSLQEMVFADFLLNQLTPRVEKVEAIKDALPVLFEIQLPLQFDSEDTSGNIELLRFATSRTVSPETVGIIANSLQEQLGQRKVEERKDILRILCNAPNVPHTATELWNSSLLRNRKMIDKSDASELLQTAGLIVRKCQAKPKFYTEHVGLYLDKCVKAFVERDTDLEHTVYLQKLLKSIVSTRNLMNLIWNDLDYLSSAIGPPFHFQSFKSENLLEHIDSKINANIDSWPTANLDIVFTVVQAFATAGYQPQNWQEKILPAILKNVNAKNQNPKHPTWMQFALQLALLDHFEIDLFERVLCEAYLTEYMQRNNFSASNFEKLVILYHEACLHKECRIDHSYIQSIIGTYLNSQRENPLQKALLDELGADKCLFNVRTPFGHCIQNLVKYDIHKRQFCSFDPVQRDASGFAVTDRINHTPDERL